MRPECLVGVARTANDQHGIHQATDDCDSAAVCGGPAFDTATKKQGDRCKTDSDCKLQSNYFVDWFGNILL